MLVSFFLFIAAILVTFPLIALLQFVPMPWFFLVLLLMHGGVVLFIVSRRRFLRGGYPVTRNYHFEYILLALYLPVLLLKVLSSFSILVLDPFAKTLAVLILTAVCLIVSAVNAYFVFRLCKRKNAEKREN